VARDHEFFLLTGEGNLRYRPDGKWGEEGIVAELTIEAYSDFDAERARSGLEGQLVVVMRVFMRDEAGSEMVIEKDGCLAETLAARSCQRKCFARDSITSACGRLMGWGDYWTREIES